MLQETPPLLSLKGVGVKRSDRWLVRGVDLTLNAQEIVTLIGPNGSGKSTTVKTALGILKPDEGTVTRQPKLKIGYVPQSLAIDWTLPLTVQRFMTLTNRLSKEELDEALTLTGVAHLRHAEVRRLSGGEFQRVMLARAIARQPDILVLDEPVQGVDFNGEIALYELIQSIRDRLGCSILMISHDLHIVMAATDHVICLNGHVCCSGEPRAVASSDAYRALFGDRAQTTLAVYEHKHDHTHLPDGRVQYRDASIHDHCHGDEGAHAQDQDKHAG